MEQLKTVITAACMLSIAVGLCNVLKPSRLFERQVRFLISLLFVIGLAAPLLQIDWTISPFVLADSIENPQSDLLTQEAQSLILTDTTQRTETALRKILAENGMTCSELNASVHIDEGQRIYISEVSAVCSDTQHACEVLRANLGEEVTLRVSEMDQ